MKNFKRIAACFLALTLSVAPITTSVKAGDEITLAAGNSIAAGNAESFQPDAASFPESTVVFPAGSTEVVQQITVDHAGYLYIPWFISGIEGTVQANLYSDAACTAKLGNGAYINAYALSGVISTALPLAGTYYLKFTSSQALTSELQVRLNPYSFNGENRALTENVDTYTYTRDYSKVVYYEITAEEAGRLTIHAVSNNSTGGLNLTLYDAKKKEASGSVYTSINNTGSESNFAVKKGTYYIGIKSGDIYRLRYSLTPVKEKSGASTKKAVEIKKGKKVEGLFLHSDKEGAYDYYKVTLPKTQYLSLTVDTAATEYIKIKIIPADSKFTIWGDTLSYYQTQKETFKSKDKFPKGVYYLQVSKTGGLNSGYYNIKFN